MKKNAVAIFAILIILLSLSSAYAGKKEEEAAFLASLSLLQSEVIREFQQNNFQRVVDLYQEHMESHPDSFVPLIVRVLYSQSLAGIGEIDDSIEMLRQLLMETSPQVDLLHLQYDLANLLYLQKRMGDAVEAYQRILIQEPRYKEVFEKAKARVNLVKARESRKRETLSLDMLEVESLLETGEVPEGTESLLKELKLRNPTPQQKQKIQLLLDKCKKLRAQKAHRLLEEARRLFDEEKKYAAVRQILEQILNDYSDVAEIPSVEALMKEVDLREGKGRN